MIIIVFSSAATRESTSSYFPEVIDLPLLHVKQSKVQNSIKIDHINYLTIESLKSLARNNKTGRELERIIKWKS